MKIKNFIKENIFNISVLMLYTIIVFIVLFFHEPWRDEAQSWLIARDLNFIGIFKQLTFEGHPPLWYLILHPFARLGFPYITTNIISCLICIISAWLILYKSPFGKAEKILFLASSPMMFYFPVISRSYCLVSLAITLCSITYPKRHDEPIKYFLSLFLLANTHIILYGLLAILTILYFCEEMLFNRKINDINYKKKFIIEFLIYSFCLILVFIPIGLSILKNNEVNAISSKSETEYAVIDKINAMEQSFNTLLRISFLDNGKIFIVIFIISLFLLGYEFEFYKKNFLILVISLLPQLYIYSFVYKITYQRASVSIFIIMFFYWIQLLENKKTNIKLRVTAEISILILLVCSVFSSLINIDNEVNTVYSSAQKTAEYIQNNIPKNATFMCNNDALASAVIPYLKDYNFWNPKSEKNFSYVIWDSDYSKELSFSEMYDKTIDNLKNENNIFILYSYLYEIDESIEFYENNKYIEKIYQKDDSYNENYIIYKINLYKDSV